VLGDCPESSQNFLVILTYFRVLFGPSLRLNEMAKTRFPSKKLSFENLYPSSWGNFSMSLLSRSLKRAFFDKND
jgi:hypothetical protein